MVCEWGLSLTKDVDTLHSLVGCAACGEPTKVPPNKKQKYFLKANCDFWKKQAKNRQINIIRAQRTVENATIGSNFTGMSVALRTSVPWLRVWAAALLLGGAGAILMYLNMWLVVGSTGNTPWQTHFRALIFMFLVPSLLIWSLLALILRRRSRAFAMGLGSISPWLAFVPASWFYFGVLFDFSSYLFLAVLLLLYLPVLTLVGAATGAVVHRIVSQPPSAAVEQAAAAGVARRVPIDS